MPSEMAHAIRAGDVLRERWADGSTGRVNLYLGSGRCGACFDAWGLMHAGRGDNAPWQGIGNTVLMHADHVHHPEHDKPRAVGEWLPLARLIWADGPPATAPQTYLQHLDLLAGRLTTRLGWPGLMVVMIAQFHPDRRDVLGIELSYEASGDASMPALLLAPETRIESGDSKTLAGAFATTGPTADGIHWAATVRVETAESLLGVNVLRQEGQAEVRTVPAGARIEFTGARGRHLILIAAGSPSRGGTIADDLTAWRTGDPRQDDDFGASATAAWQARWGSACAAAPESGDRVMWARSLFYCLCSYAPESHAHAPAPAHGWTGNGCRIYHPRDVPEVVAALLSLKHFDIARSIVEFHRARLGAGGPHEGEAAGVVAQMARQVSRALHDATWSREIAWPLVHESARHFASRLAPAAGGTWALDDPGLEPWARQCLQDAVAMAGEVGASGQEYANYRGILSDGFVQSSPPVDEDLGDICGKSRADAERVQFFAPGESTIPFHLPTHGRFLGEISRGRAP